MARDSGTLRVANQYRQSLRPKDLLDNYLLHEGKGCPPFLMIKDVFDPVDFIKVIKADRESTQSD